MLICFLLPNNRVTARRAGTQHTHIWQWYTLVLLRYIFVLVHFLYWHTFCIGTLSVLVHYRIDTLLVLVHSGIGTLCNWYIAEVALLCTLAFYWPPISLPRPQTTGSHGRKNDRAWNWNAHQNLPFVQDPFTDFSKYQKYFYGLLCGTFEKFKNSVLTSGGSWSVITPLVITKVTRSAGQLVMPHIYGLHQGDMVTKNGETPSGHHEGGMITCSPGDSPFGHQSRWNDQDPATSWTPALDCACHPSCKIQGQKYFTFTLFTAPPRKAKRVQRCCQLPFYIT